MPESPQRWPRPLDPGHYMRGINATTGRMSKLDALELLDELRLLIQARISVLCAELGILDDEDGVLE
jgi:hypothetical protein